MFDDTGGGFTPNLLVMARNKAVTASNSFTHSLPLLMYTLYPIVVVVYYILQEREQEVLILSYVVCKSLGSNKRQDIWKMESQSEEAKHDSLGSLQFLLDFICDIEFRARTAPPGRDIASIVHFITV